MDKEVLRSLQVDAVLQIRRMDDAEPAPSDEDDDAEDDLAGDAASALPDLSPAPTELDQLLDSLTPDTAELDALIAAATPDAAELDQLLASAAFDLSDITDV